MTSRQLSQDMTVCPASGYLKCKGSSVGSQGSFNTHFPGCLEHIEVIDSLNRFILSQRIYIHFLIITKYHFCTYNLYKHTYIHLQDLEILMSMLCDADVYAEL